MIKQLTEFSLLRKALILMAFPVVVQIILFWCLVGLMNRTEMEAHAADRAKTVIASINNVIEQFNNVGFNFLVYEAKTKPFFAERYVASVAKLEEALDVLDRDIQQSPEKHISIVKYARSEVEACLQILNARKKMIDGGGNIDLAEELSLQDRLGVIIGALNSIVVDEKQLHEELIKNSSERLMWTIIWIMGISLAISIPLMALMHRGTAKRLRVLIDNSLRLSVGEKLAPTLGGNDEIAQIDRVFHEMANVLQEAARKERAIVDNAADVICSVDESGNFVAVSPAAEKMWGYSPAELIGKSWLELIAPDDVQRSWNWADKLREGDSETVLENKIKRKNGGLMDMRWSAHWSPTEKSMFCVVHDITERLELERFREQFVAMISHDLRTPLTAVTSTLELLGDGTWGDLNEKGKAKVSRATENLNHSITLINNLLDLQKMQSGKIELNIAEVEIGPLLKRCASVVAPLAETASIEVTVPESDLVLDADAQRVAQVLINLLGNAIKFSPPKSKVSISTNVENNHLTVSVRDQGPGIPLSMRVSIFEPYHQMPTDCAEKKEGTGLGLAICKAIVDAHEGEIGVDSEPGKGSSFWFRLSISR